MEYEELLLSEEERNIEIEEVIEIIEVSDTETYTIESDSAFPALGEPNENLNHQLMNGRTLSDQHPIEAITGLRAELDDIEALDVVYSNERNHANYYLWQDGYGGVGFFVAMDSGTNTIKIWDEGDEILGVTVSEAAFVGWQRDLPRGDDYGLVVHNGVVDVRCEYNVDIGDYVVANHYGVAQKSNNGYGYKVVDVKNEGDIRYAKIILNISANKIYDLSSAVGEVNQRIGNAESNITAAINVANAAYNKASEIGEISEIAKNNALEALDKVNDASEKVDGFDERLQEANKVAVQAQAIAESAATSAESMRNEAIDKANQALADTDDLRGELEALSNDMSGNLSEAVAGLQGSQEELKQTASGMQNTIDKAVSDIEGLTRDLKPLVTWPSEENPIGVGGFVAKADADSATLASVVTWKGEAGDSLAGFVQEATENNATVRSIASYNRKDEEGNIIGSGASGLIAQVDDNKASISLIAEFDGNIAGLQAQVDENTSSLSALASHVIGDYITVDTWSETDKDTSKIYYVKDEKNYWYYNNRWQSTDKPYEAGLTGAIAGIQQTADDNAANIKMIAGLEGDFGESLAGFVSKATAENAEIQALASYKYTDSKGVEHTSVSALDAYAKDNEASINLIAGIDGSLAGLQAQVDDTTSKVALVADRVMGKYVVVDTWDEINRDTDTVYYAQDTKLYWYYDDKWTSTQDAYTAGLPAAIAGIQVVTDDNSSTINQLVSWQGDTEDSMASIKQKADQNGASINMLVSSVDKYSVGEYSQSYGLTYAQAKSVLKEGMVYVPTIRSDGAIWHYEDFEDLEDSEDFEARNYFYQGCYYEWTVNTQGQLDWVEYGNSVAFFSKTPEPSSALIYWYIDSNEPPEGYAPYTLYKWDDTNQFWVAVSSLERSESNRQTSMIRQEVNKIAAEVTNTSGSVATLSVRLGNTESAVDSLATWSKGGDENGEQYNLATIKQTADDAGANVALVVAEKDGEKIINAGSIVMAINNQTSESSINLNADRINLEGAITANQTFSIDEVGYMTAIGGKIGGWTLGETSLTSEAGSDENKSIVSLYSLPNYWHNDDETTGRAAEVLTVQVGTATPFRLSKDGTLECTKADIEGTIKSTSGEIAGWQIKDWGMGKVVDPDAESTRGFGLYTEGVLKENSNVLAIGTMSAGLGGSWNSCEFRVKGDGSLYSTKGNIAGWDITETQITRVQNFGTVEKPDHRRVSLAVGARPNDSTDTNLTANNKQAAFYITASDAAHAAFSVDWDGNLIANSAKITGTITANSVISNGVLLGRDPKTNTDAWHIGDEDYPRAIWADGSSGRVFLTPDGVVFRGTVGEPLMKTWKELLS